jgi:hypothetical protein
VTIRDYLKRRVRTSNILVACGFVLFGLGGWLCAALNKTWLLPLPLVGFVLFGGGALYRVFIHCPKCGGGLGMPPAYFGNPFGREFRFCPVCGVSLDTQLDESEKV